MIYLSTINQKLHRIIFLGGRVGCASFELYCNWSSFWELHDVCSLCRQTFTLGLELNWIRILCEARGKSVKVWHTTTQLEFYVLVLLLALSSSEFCLFLGWEMLKILPYFNKTN